MSENESDQVEQDWEQILRSRRETVSASQLLQECALVQGRSEIRFLIRRKWGLGRMGLWLDPKTGRACSQWEALKMEVERNGLRDP